MQKGTWKNDKDTGQALYSEYSEKNTSQQKKQKEDSEPGLKLAREKVNQAQTFGTCLQVVLFLSP